MLEDDTKRLKKQRHTSKRIFERLRDEYGFAGGITGARHDLNSLATVIWRQFNEANSVDEIMSLLAAAFPDEVPAKIADDLNDLVEELLRKNLLMPAAMEPYLLQPAQPIRWPRNP
ncbi:MAG: PqqD family protein [Rhodospirillaceae bacterium]|nr:PqqD family protein [Rhodospirillaceae bacterium]